MTAKRSDNDNTIFQSLKAAFLILLMHVILLGSVGVLVLFFYGIINHSYIMLAALLTFFIGLYWLYRRIIASKQVLNDLAGGSFKGKTVEVRLLGGVANFTISDAESTIAIEHNTEEAPKQLEAPRHESISDLSDLAQLYEKKLITRDEYSRAKEKFFRQSP